MGKFKVADVTGRPFKERVEYTKRAFLWALMKPLQDGLDLIVVGCHEQAICHRLAVYLEGLFPAHSIDCEYNRSVTNDKDFDSEELTGPMRPDIVAHKRLNNGSNQFALEGKAGRRGHSKRDRQKITNLVDSDRYDYGLGALLWIQNSKPHLEGRGEARINLLWYEGRKYAEQPVDPAACRERPRLTRQGERTPQAGASPARQTGLGCP